ncbi:hypothetical protein DSO57_1021142 [Entomophthora muscae]|uniref:Uncharacterized protein n=1 Tax=Entomophthora muscae TaxID=34485 RepID=A0ACC2RUK8_9FUNG|nr:hypothetical protein DSO57_1021142 [Entomophthora muscae]
MKLKLQKIRKQSELLRGLAAELISNIDDIAEEYASVLNEVQKLRKYKQRIMKSLSIGLNDDMESDDTEQGEDSYPRALANGAKRPAFRIEDSSQRLKRAANIPKQAALIISSEPSTVGNKLVNSLDRVKSFKKISKSSFQVLPIRIVFPTKNSLNVVLATEARCSTFSDSVSLIFDEKVQPKSVCALLTRNAPVYLAVSPAEFAILGNERLKHEFDNWSGPKGSIDVVTELVAFVFRAWQDNHWYEFSEEVTRCGARSRVLRLKFYGSLLVRDATEASNNLDRLLPLNLYLTGLSSMDQSGDLEGAFHKAINAIEAAEELFKDMLNDQTLSKLLAFWSLSLVALFGRNLSPARMVGAQWPSEIIPLSQATELTPKVHDSVLFAIQYLLAIRKELVKDSRYRSSAPEVETVKSPSSQNEI